MTHIDEKGNVWVISEVDGKCELCESVEETRPYGPDGKEVCFKCGMLDEENMKRQMALRFGWTE